MKFTTTPNVPGAVFPHTYTTFAPCPFCGVRRANTARHHGDRERYLVVCHQCGAQGPTAENTHAAVAAWEGRRGEPKPNEFPIIPNYRRYIYQPAYPFFAWAESVDFTNNAARPFVAVCVVCGQPRNHLNEMVISKYDRWFNEVWFFRVKRFDTVHDPLVNRYP